MIAIIKLDIYNFNINFVSPVLSCVWRLRLDKREQSGEGEDLTFQIINIVLYKNV